MIVRIIEINLWIIIMSLFWLFDGKIIATNLNRDTH